MSVLSTVPQGKGWVNAINTNFGNTSGVQTTATGVKIDLILASV